jgi:nitrous oxide reductase
MENKRVSSSKGTSRRAFLSASAVTAVAAPIAAGAAPASAAATSAATPHKPPY